MLLAHRGLRRLQYDVVFCLALGVGIVGCYARQPVFESLKLQWRPMHARGKSNELYFAIGIGARIEIKLMEPGEAVGYVNFDSSGVDWLRIGGGYGEFQRAGAGATIDCRNLLRLLVRLGLSCTRKACRTGEQEKTAQ